MKWRIFNSYGVVDHPDELYENDTMALLASKNNEIVLLRKQILVLQKLEESPKNHPMGRLNHQIA